MTADEAHQLHAAMRQFGIPGAVTPLDTDDLDCPWFVVDEAGRDITAHVLVQVAAARRRQPTRGFVIAR
ncbi:hypothetical protein [Streptomyces sp. NBC_01294]|uniref:hypothetical protein n=1 Tax=Streptomyces sp. NBC_01294 TaxID=2903815 RepID=UPI002DD9B243|nr:hypothetical protein [Streptomyces sp. NBC_01294]WRZ56418.1 hypothetical protein OG534_07990 [Streptomyces sp. NBC_01294]